MATLKLKDIVKAKQGVDLEFTDFQVEETSTGINNIRLTLKKPIDTVFGRTIRDNVTQDAARLEVNDVETVVINPSAQEEITRIEEEEEKKPEAERKMPIVWEVEGKSGRLKCDSIRLDVSNALEVWVTKDGFAAFSNKQRTDRRNQRNSTLVERMNSNKTKKEFGNIETGQGQPTSVASN